MTPRAAVVIAALGTAFAFLSDASRKLQDPHIWTR